MRGIHPWAVDSAYKGPVTRKTFPCNDVIMHRYHGCYYHCWLVCSLLRTVDIITSIDITGMTLVIWGTDKLYDIRGPFHGQIMSRTSNYMNGSIWNYWFIHGQLPRRFTQIAIIIIKFKWLNWINAVMLLQGKDSSTPRQSPWANSNNARYRHLLSRRQVHLLSPIDAYMRQ